MSEEKIKKKYEFTGETKKVDGITVRRIRATAAFGIVEVGDMGGWIEKEENLHQSGNAWVRDNAIVSGNARVQGNAIVRGNAMILQVNHLLVIGPIGSRNGFTTFYRDKDNEITVNCGYFLSKIDKFLEEVQKTQGNNRHALAYRAAAETAKICIDPTEKEQ